MDPFTMMALAGAFGGIAQMSNHPSTPGNSLAGENPINLQSYQPYFNQVMSAGFNPQAQQYQNSSQVANAGLNASLANRGIINSSAGTQAVQGLNTSLANSYINNQMQRQQQALQTVGQFQNGAMQSNLGLGQANNQQGWNTFGGNTQNNQNTIGGINSLMGGLSGAMGAYNTNQNQLAAQAQAQAQYNQYMNFMQNQQGYMNGGSGNPFSGGAVNLSGPNPYQ